MLKFTVKRNIDINLIFLLKVIVKKIEFVLGGKKARNEIYIKKNIKLFFDFDFDSTYHTQSRVKTSCDIINKKMTQT